MVRSHSGPGKFLKLGRHSVVLFIFLVVLTYTICLNLPVRMSWTTTCKRLLSKQARYSWNLIFWQQSCREIRLRDCSNCKIDDQNFWHTRNPIIWEFHCALWHPPPPLNFAPNDNWSARNSATHCLGPKRQLQRQNLYSFFPALVSDMQHPRQFWTSTLLIFPFLFSSIALFRAAGKYVKPSTATSAETSQHLHQKTTRGSRSHSRSSSPLRQHGSEGRREKCSSRSRSPQSSRCTRRYVILKFWYEH